MDTKTLVDLVAVIENRKQQELKLHIDTEFDFAYKHGYIHALEELIEYLHIAIETEIAQIEGV